MTTKAKPPAPPASIGAAATAAESAPTGAPKPVTATAVTKAAASKAAAKTPAASTASAAKTDKPAKKEKPKKLKMVRDSFTMPESDYAKLEELKKKCLSSGVHVKKSELLRAGLLNLSKLNEASLIKAVGQVEIIKTGRPAKSES